MSENSCIDDICDAAPQVTRARAYANSAALAIVEPAEGGAPVIPNPGTLSTSGGRRLLAMFLARKWDDAGKGGTVAGVCGVDATEVLSEDQCAIHITGAWFAAGDAVEVSSLMEVRTKKSRPHLVTFGGADFDLPELSTAGWLEGAPRSWTGRYSKLGTGAEFLRESDELHFDMLKIMLRRRDKPQKHELPKLLSSVIVGSRIRLLSEERGGVGGEVLNAGRIMALYVFWRRKTGCMSFDEERLAITSLRRALARVERVFI